LSKLQEHIERTSPESGNVKVTSNVVDARKSFYRMCIYYVVSGYRSAQAFGLFALTDEEDISDLIVTHIDKCLKEDEVNVDVDVERRDRAKPVDGIKVKAKRRKRYDFFFKSFEKPTQREIFTAEAKILKCTDNDLLKKYASQKGMRKYLESIYDGPGFMIGYVMVGTITETITNLNKIIYEDSFYNKDETLVAQQPINTHPYFYISKHKKGSLEHLILDFASGSSTIV
jgi:hypothetical protein